MTHTHTHVYTTDGARLDPVVRGAIEGVCAPPWPSQASATEAEESERELDLYQKIHTVYQKIAMCQSRLVFEQSETCEA